MKCFAIKDIKAEGFNTPFFQPTFGLAERAFKEAVKDPQTHLSKTPDDFSLWYVGSFDQTQGVMTSEAEPKHVCNAN